MTKYFIPCLYIYKGRAVTGFGHKNIFASGNLSELSMFYSDHGADRLLVFDFSSGDAEHDRSIACIKDICKSSQVPVYAAGNVRRVEDVKKLLYAGCSAAVLNAGKPGNIEMLEEVSKRFGKNKIAVCVSSMDEYLSAHWTGYEQNAASGEDTNEEKNYDANEESEEDEGSEEDEISDVAEKTNELEHYDMPYDVSGKVVYEYETPRPILGGAPALVMSLVFIGAGLLFGILGGFVMMKKRRSPAAIRPDIPDDEDEMFTDYELRGMSTTDLTGDTVYLADNGIEDDNPTRLLADDAVMLTLEDETDPQRIYRIMLEGTMTIGRGNCDVMISGDDALSKRHAELFAKDGSVYVKDLSSSNGTRVNGVRVMRSVLSDNDKLTIGSRTYTVRI